MREVSHDSVFLSICSISRQISSVDIIKTIFYLPIILFACVQGSPIPIPYNGLCFPVTAEQPSQKLVPFPLLSGVWLKIHLLLLPISDSYLYKLKLGDFFHRDTLCHIPFDWLSDPQLCLSFILIHHFIWVLIGYNSKIAINSHIAPESYWR